MKRVAATLALSLVVLGCSEPVQLITAPVGVWDDGCFTFAAAGRLIVDPEYGTAIVEELQGGTSTVAWRPGFRARRVGPEVEVLDPRGNVVARTGRRYVIAGGYVDEGSYGGWPGLPKPVFMACDTVLPLP
jgi:hypothetical protein